MISDKVILSYIKAIQRKDFISFRTSKEVIL